MRSIKKRLLSLLLTLITILSLLPTSALAASGTGKGITITKDQAYWSTRLLANGTPYSYRPPMAAGRLLYCLDSGLGYHNATQSFFDSYTYISATNADADTVLKTAIANSGLGEMDAATLANVKWLMTYINDSKASNVGQLFMAVQTYVWDHQSYRENLAGMAMQAATPTPIPTKCTWISSTGCSRRRHRRTRHFSARSRNMPRRAWSHPS